MIILLPCHYPWHIIECHGSQSEISVIIDLVDFSHEHVQVRRIDTVRMGVEVGGA